MRNLMFISLLTFGCMVETKVADESRDKVMYCVDTRDGEKFSFNTNDIKYAKVSLDGVHHSFHVVDANGKEWMVNERSESWLKCHPQKGDRDER